MKESIVKEKVEEKELEKPIEESKIIEEESVKESKPEKEEKKEEIETTEKTKFKKATEKPKKVEKEIKKMDENKKKKGKKIAIICIIFAIIIIFISTIFALINMNSNKILSGVSIKGIDVSGLTKEEAKAKLDLIYNEKKEKEINLKYEDYVSSLNPTLMEVNYDVEKAVDEAYLIGKGDNIFINNYNILFTLIGKRDINVDMTLNEDVTKQSIQDIGINIPGVVIESSYSIEGDKLIITKGKEGKYVDTEALLNKVKENLNNISITEDYIEIPVIDKKPEEIDIDKIHSEIYKEVKDAYYTKDPFTVYPEVEGIDFDVEAAKAQIAAEDKEEYEIQLIITKPKVTIDQIGTEAFPDQLATYSTRYDASLRDRSTNLEIACSKINGKVLMAGETFSYNQTLGARTAAAGYKNAQVYENGQVVDGIGGGICQISSTLYNAVLMSNLQIVERRNHQFITSYAPAGRDATVAYGLIDFKFKNTRKYPIKISASAKNGIATVSIFGIKEEEEYTFSFSTKTVATIPYTTRYEEDASLPVGTEKVKQKGANGIKTETYITKMLNGKIVSTELLSKDTYDAMARIVVRGTKGAKKNETTQTQKPSSDTTNKNQNSTTTNTNKTNTTNNTATNTNKTNDTDKKQNNTNKDTTNTKN